MRWLAAAVRQLLAVHRLPPAVQRLPPAVRHVPRRPWHVGMGAFAAGAALACFSTETAFTTAAALLGGLVLLRAPPLGALAAALVLAGAAVGDWRLTTLDAPARLIRDRERVTLRAELSTPPRPSAFGASAEARVTGGRLDGARLLLRAPRWAPLPRATDVGMELVVEGRLARLDAPSATPAGAAAAADDPPARSSSDRSPSDPSSPARSSSDRSPSDPSNPARSSSDRSAGTSSGAQQPAFDFAAHLRRRGVAAELFLDRAHLTGRRRGGLPGVVDRMRERGERAVVAGLSPEDGALLRGMVLGQDEAISTSVRDDFRASGLAHLLAVSGQNVMLLAALALPALMLAGVGRATRFATLAGLIVVYVPLAGAGPSLQRAGVMGLAGVAALAASRPASRSYALLLAAAATLVWNPRAWQDPGWQLSFAAVVGILALGVPLGRALRATAEAMIRAREVPGPAPEEAAPAHPAPGPRVAVAGRAKLALVRGLADGLAITVTATLATAPLLALHFGSVPLAGLPANVLALPAVAPAMWLGMLKTAVGQLGSQLGVPLAEPLGWLAALPVGYLGSLAERFADLPGAQLALPIRSPAALLAAYLLLAALAVALFALARPLAGRAGEYAGRWRRLPPAHRATAVVLIGLALVLGTATILRGPGIPGRVTVRFLDVGQGDATLIQHPDGTAVLFDAGPPEAGVARLLRRAGVRRLALIVATHASRDHHGGLVEVLRHFPVATLLDGGDGTPDPAFRAVVREARARGVRRVKATAPLGLALAGGELRIDLLSPPPRPPGPAPEDPNPRAVVALVQAGAFDLLLSADAESEALLPLDLPDVDAMKVPHHGSADPGLPEVLDELRPEVAAVEVGPNTYGHPAPSTLTALDRAGVRTYRTDHDGTVNLSLAGGAMEVETER